MNKKRLGKDYKELGMRMSREMYDALKHAADVSERSVSSQIRYCFHTNIDIVHLG